MYLKILYADYELHYAIIELIGEWNDCIYNDIMMLRREITDMLQKEGITKFILVAEKCAQLSCSRRQLLLRRMVLMKCPMRKAGLPSSIHWTTFSDEMHTYGLQNFVHILSGFFMAGTQTAVHCLNGENPISHHLKLLRVGLINQPFIPDLSTFSGIPIWGSLPCSMHWWERKMSIITINPQTTRHRIIGILNGDGFQIVFSDTPGFVEEPAYKMHKMMNAYISLSFDDADIILFITGPL
jgi:hypothetical protein